MNIFWTDERNQFSIETVQVILITETHFKGISCVDFYSFLKEQPNPLEKSSHPKDMTKICSGPCAA
jgi:hypothetical protein